MSASIHPSNWDWTALGAIATFLLALGTFWMAIMTRRLAKEGIEEVNNANKLAKAAEDQRDIAARNEYSQRQPVFIPIFSRQRHEDRLEAFKFQDGEVKRDRDASFFNESATKTVSVRIVLRNVGKGAGRIIEDSSTNLVEVDVGTGMRAVGSPVPVVVAPGDTAEIWAVGKPTMSPQLSPRKTIRGMEPFARVRFHYTDLTNSMVTKCDILYELYSADELRPVDMQNSEPRPFSTETNSTSA